MWIAETTFALLDERGREVQYRPGQPVDVRTVAVEKRLVGEGKIRLWTPNRKAARAEPDDPRALLRVAFIQAVTTHYSGGRVYLYQMANALALNGADVYVVAKATPPWAGDYPKCPRLRIVQSILELPPDIDVVVTDGKGPYGKDAAKLARGRRLVCVNFETPNWVDEFCHEYAKLLGLGEKGNRWREAFSAADAVVGLTPEGTAKALEWYRIAPQKTAILPPALNQTAADNPKRVSMEWPYCATCARNVRYKGLATAYKAVCAMPDGMGLAIVGMAPRPALRPVAGHPVKVFGGVGDDVKFGLFANAKAVLAPSLFEGFGLVPLEALSAGAPVVAYDLPVLRETYGGRIHYAPHGDEAAFVAKAAQVVGSGQRPSEATRAWTPCGCASSSCPTWPRSASVCPRT